MQKITIKKHGIFFSFWDESSATWIDKDISESTFPISRYLWYSVQLTDEITLRDLLKLLNKHKDIIQVMFSHALTGITCDQIIELINSPKKVEPVPMNILYLFKIGEVTPIKDETLEFINIYPVIMGVSVKDGEEEEGVHHLSSFDVRDWLDLPLAIDSFIEFTNIAEDEIEMEGLISWQLFEVINTILSQISLTLQITNALITKDSNKLESGPMLIEELFIWLDELDSILLSK